jgi:hypothetical protein
MNMAVKPVPAGRGRRHRWSADQKQTVQQEWLATGRLQRAIGATARGAGVGALHHFLYP